MKTTITLLAASLLLVGIPMAAADETHPDCEADQPWIGYRTTLVARNFYYANGSPGGLEICEGEHWDGQDTVQSDPGNCNPTTRLNPTDLFVDLCLGPDPNGMPGDDPLNPLGLRVSSKSASEVYVGANIALVGRAVVYVSDDMSAIYLRDNTPGNVLATVVSTPRITQGYVSENDCDQATYQAGAMAGVPLCGRDNTAVTVEYDLTP